MDQGIGQPVLRKEDFRLLTGRGQYSDDLNAAGQAHAHMVRSPHAHARIKSIDVAEARAAPGVLGVLTGADYLSDGLIPIPKRDILARLQPDVARRPEIERSHVFPIEAERIRCVGEITALVVAETKDQAKDAAELVRIDYQPLPVNTDARAALEPGAPRIWDWAVDNIGLEHERGDKAATEAAFAAADHITRLEIQNNRVTGVPMEPRAAIGHYDGESGEFLLEAGGQGVGSPRDALAGLFDVAGEKVRVVSRDVGGGYGTRNCLFPEFVLALWAAKRLGRPVKWSGERAECFLGDPAARDVLSQAELALDADGGFLAVRVTHLVNFGVEGLILLPFARSVDFVVGVYDIRAAYVKATGVFTNRGPISVLRSAGRPEPMFLIERLIDTAAAEMGLDAIDLRRRNVIPPISTPYLSATDVPYDSGDFGQNMKAVLKLADWDGFPARQAQSRARGLYRGIGLANYIEWATGVPEERVELEIKPDGWVDLVAGTMDSGQGHATAYAQVVTELLGVPFDCVHLLEGDTDRVKFGTGSHSSRSMRLAGTLMKQCADEIIEKGRDIAARVLESAPGDIQFSAGIFTIAGTDRALSIFQVAEAAAEQGGKLEAGHEITELMTAFPNGCHVCELEVDAETGAVNILRHSAVDDVGRIINPVLVEGQTHGGTAMGIGQALMEECAYDSRTGQLLSGSFMDYSMPRADDLPSFDLAHNTVLAPNNPLGIKGAGEGGTSGAPPAVINAIVDALRELGVTHVEMPTTPEKVWRAIRAAGNR